LMSLPRASMSAVTAGSPPLSDSRNFSQAYSAAPNRCFRREALAPAAFHAYAEVAGLR
jgi:hypothetical protein